MQKPRLFLGHGHDKETLSYVKELLSLIGLEPIVVAERPQMGRAIREKVRNALRTCDGSIIILSKDDCVDSKGDKYWQPRLNVLHELGWLESQADRPLIVIAERGCSIPSNIRDLGHLSYIRGDYAGLSLSLLKELRSFGLYKNYREAIEVFKEVRGHENIYREFERLLSEIDLEDGVPYTIRTINSFPAEEEIRRAWDKKVVDFLDRRRDCTFIRVVFYQRNRSWVNQLRFIYKNYLPLENYYHYEYESSPRIMELFLIEEADEAIMSFSTLQTDEFAPITVGIRMCHKKLCQQLRAYHERHLRKTGQRITIKNARERLEKLREIESSLMD